MKVLDYYKLDCQMSNHFYFALQCFIEQQKTGIQTGYLTNKHVSEKNGLENKFKLFNIDLNYIKYDVKSDDVIISNNATEELNRYKQVFGKNFTIDDLESFIKNTFIKSGNFIKNDNQSNVVALHIRNKDYLNPVHDCFDRIDYLNRSLNSLDKNIDTIEIFSDDLNYTYQNYDNIICEKIPHIHYNYGNTDTEDFIKFACIKNKIIWNSTFSYWAAFIGNVLYPNSYQNVITQSKTISKSLDRITMNPKWRFV